MQVNFDTGSLYSIYEHRLVAFTRFSVVCRTESSWMMELKHNQWIISVDLRDIILVSSIKIKITALCNYLLIPASEGINWLQEPRTTQ